MSDAWKTITFPISFTNNISYACTAVGSAKETCSTDAVNIGSSDSTAARKRTAVSVQIGTDGRYYGGFTWLAIGY